jgi:thiamine-phosphate pyrophosphorylase
MANRLALPALYVILDAALLPADPVEFTAKLLAAGVRLLQYRNKTASPREILQTSQALCAETRHFGAQFVVNDRPDIARMAGAQGVHVGQLDVSVAAARAVIGSDGLVGVSTHNLQQFAEAARADCDYIAVGPIFGTTSKSNSDPVVGVRALRKLRSLTEKPIVAIGGITAERAREVLDAGADSVAVISDILAAKKPLQRVRQYLELLPAGAARLRES